MLGSFKLTDESISASTLAAPTPTPGFEVEIHYDTSKSFSPLGVYRCAIDCMYQFTQTGWDKELTGGFTVWVDGFDVQIDVETSRGSHGSLPLESSHIVLGLYETMVDISAHSRFCEVLTTLLQHRRQLGTLVIEKRTPRTPEKGGINATGSIPVKGSPWSNTVTYPSGQITDLDDDRFSVSYTYSGARINSKDIFMTILDALATAAQFSPDAPFKSLNAISVSGDCVMDILEVDSQCQANYSFVTKALRIIIVGIMVYLRKFGEMTFQLKWKAASMAEGSIELAGHSAAAQ